MQILFYSRVVFSKRGEYGMRMKRFVSVLAAAVMVFGVTGCMRLRLTEKQKTYPEKRQEMEVSDFLSLH